MAKIITYSPAYTLVPTYECFNRCSYCNFRTNPFQSPWLELETAKQILTSLEHQGIIEILILSGEIHPLSPRRKLWIERIYDLAKLALSMGFLPHTNAGVLSYEEMALLKEVNVSLGLMVEQVSPKLLDDVHKHAPTKIPQLRLQQLQWAGELKIPFTTGILMGLGESKQDRKDSLDAIALLHGQYGHIQEVILQPYQPGKKDIFQGKPLNDEEILEVIALAREILPKDIALQIPPNLLKNSQLILKSLELGVTDLGGIVPKDEVNPDYHHQKIDLLRQELLQQGYQLKPRLPVYPQYYSWLSDSLQSSLYQKYPSFN